jgi:uncharacterized protein (DUF58 family)
MKRGWIRRIAAAFHRHIRYRITRSGYLFAFALLLVGATAIASGNNLLFLVLAAMMATVLISDFVSRLCLAGLELELILPEHISAKQAVTARLKLRNLKWFPSFAIHLSSRPGAEAPVLRRDIVFPAVPGRTSVQADAPAMFPRRGLHRENLFFIATRFPFGFVERRVSVSIRSEAVIYPPLEGSFTAEDLLGALRGDLEKEQRGLGSDFYRLRPYELHESARYVDWKSSAHTRELQVREFAREERSTVYLFFDLRMPAGDEFERALECCAYLVWMLSGESTRIRFRTQLADLMFPDQVDVYEILRTLALVESDARAGVPDEDEDDPELLFTANASEFVARGWRPERVVSPGDSVGTNPTVQ